MFHNTWTVADTFRPAALRVPGLAACALSIALGSGCDAEPVDDLPGAELLEPTQFRTGEEEQGLMAFLNDHEVSTRDVLDFDCAIHSDSAMHIDRYRRGKDKDYGTDDDQTIDDEAELDAIKEVGPWTIGVLYDCAEDFGYIAPSCGQTGSWSQTFGSGDDWQEAVPAALVEEIESYWGLADLCDDYGGGMAPSYFDQVTIHYADCDVQTYVVTWRQAVEPGVQEIRTHWYDATLDPYDGTCEPGPA